MLGLGLWRMALLLVPGVERANDEGHVGKAPV